MSKLLINESPLQVQPSLAMAIGLNEAIFLQQLHYWLGASKNFKDGKKWIYNTYDEWILQLKYMSLSTLKRTVKSLKSQNLILVSNFDSKRSNQVNYYAINYDVLSIVEQNISQAIDSIDSVKMNQSKGSNWTNALGQNEPMDSVKMNQSSLGQNDTLLYTREYQENTQETTQEKKSTTLKKPKFSFEEAIGVSLPDGVEKDLWVAYIEMRQALKKLPTEKAINLLLKDLSKWGASKANQSLKNSIQSNWVGLFEPKQAFQTYATAYQQQQNQKSNRWSEIQELIIQEEQGNDSYGF